MAALDRKASASYGVSMVDHFSSPIASPRGCGGRRDGELFHVGKVSSYRREARPNSPGVGRVVGCCRMDSERWAATLRCRNVLPRDRNATGRQLFQLRLHNVRRMAIRRKILVAVASYSSSFRILCAAITLDLGIHQLDRLGFCSVKKSLSNLMLVRTRCARRTAPR